MKQPTPRELEKLLLASSPGLARERERLVMKSMADGKGGVSQPGVKHWLKFCIWGRRISPIVPVDSDSPRHERIAAEDLLMDFALWLVYCKPSGRKISPKTARKYVSQVQGWHRKLKHVGHAICGTGTPLPRLQALIRGLRKEMGDGTPRPRYGVRTQHLAAAMAQELSDGSAKAQNWRAALTTAFCGLLRGGEFAVQDGDVWEAARHLTRADVRFFRVQGVRHAGIMIRQLKTNVSLKGKTVEVVLRGGGTFFDPVEELWQLFKRDWVAPEQRAATPLFRDGAEAFTVGRVREMVKSLMAAIGCDPKFFGAHSLRIGGATAALAAGIDPAVIRCMGRWSSDVYEIYMRLTRQTATRLSSTVASTSFADLERGFNTEALDELADVPVYDVDLDNDDGSDDDAVTRDD